MFNSIIMHAKKYKLHQIKTKEILIISVFLSAYLKYDVFLDIKPATNNLYYEALQNHFFSYFKYYHTKAVGFVIEDKILLLFFGLNNILTSKFIVSSLFSILSVVLVYRSMIKIRVNNIFALLFTVLWAYLLFKYDLWRSNSNHDGMNPFIISLYCYSSLLIIANSKINIGITLHSVSIVLLYLYIPSSPLFVLITIIFFLLVRYYDKSKLSYKHLISILLVIFIVQILPLKNVLHHNIFTTSSVLGQNSLQKIAYFHFNRMNNKLIDSDLPKWYKQCWESSKVYDNSVVPWIGPVYGLCGLKLNTTHESGEFYEIDKIYFERMISGLPKDSEVRKSILKDFIIEEHEPWKLAGGVTESNRKFSIEYGKESLNFLKILILDNKKYSLDLTLDNIFRSINYNGFYYDYEPDINRHSFVRNIILDYIWNLLNILSLLVLISSFTFPLIIAFINKNVILKFCPNIPYYLIISFCFSMNLSIFAFFTCCDNVRMSIGYIQIPIIFGSILFTYALNSIAPLNQQNK